MLAPICLFTYNRIEETTQTVEALQNNNLAQSSTLFIFSDGPKDESAISKVDEVRRYIKTINGFNSIVIKESIENKGLANSIIDGVTQIIEEFGKVIVLEDDLISSPGFLKFMNQALDYYDSKKKIQSINGYSLFLKSNIKEVYFQTRPFPWGWATWNDRWNKNIFDKNRINSLIKSDKTILKDFSKKCGNDISRMLLNSLTNKNDSWYVRWTFDHFRNMTYSVFPYRSFIQNIGHNIDGTHCKGINSYLSVPINNIDFDHILSVYYSPDKNLEREFLAYFSLRHKLKIRIKLLTSMTGRRRLIDEIITKIDIR
jgi:hypothetical protein